MACVPLFLLLYYTTSSQLHLHASMVIECGNVNFPPTVGADVHNCVATCYTTRLDTDIFFVPFSFYFCF